MGGWTGFLIGIVALMILAPLAAWIGRRHGKAIKGASGLAFIMLGFGHVMDPPSRHLIEAVEGEENADEATGEPKDATGGS